MNSLMRPHVWNNLSYFLYQICVAFRPFFIVCTRNYKVSLMSVSPKLSDMAEAAESVSLAEASALSICCTGLVALSLNG